MTRLELVKHTKDARSTFVSLSEDIFRLQDLSLYGACNPTISRLFLSFHLMEPCPPENKSRDAVNKQLFPSKSPDTHSTEPLGRHL
jgi:hypothetical protein